MARPDVIVTNNGSTFSFTLCTKAAREWVKENLQIESWQWLGQNTFAVDHRFAQGIAAIMADDEDDGPGLVVR